MVQLFAVLPVGCIHTDGGHAVRPWVSDNAWQKWVITSAASASHRRRSTRKACLRDAAATPGLEPGSGLELWCGFADVDADADAEAVAESPSNLALFAWKWTEVFQSAIPPGSTRRRPCVPRNMVE